MRSHMRETTFGGDYELLYGEGGYLLAQRIGDASRG